MAAESSAKPRWGRWFGRESNAAQTPEPQEKQGPPRWSMGVLNDPHTVQVPGSVLLLASNRNEPLGLRNAPARTSHSSIPTGFFDPGPSSPATARRSSSHGPPADEKKKTKDGKIILEPQPEDSANDPLNWPAWRRDTALFSLGFYCLVGGGITPLLAAGFYDVADDYGVSVEDVSLTTGLYMMGMGLGSVVASPTAILWGKRPVYLAGAILLVISSVWCALSPNFASLIVARIVQGIAVSPVECLPSATIAEIFFLHERAYRIGIYTLLLLGGKNLIPLVSAVIIQALNWRWVFWVVAIIVAAWFFALFLFVPETFWDRTPHPKSRKPSRRPSFIRRLSSQRNVPQQPVPEAVVDETADPSKEQTDDVPASPSVATPSGHQHKNLHVGFAPNEPTEQVGETSVIASMAPNATAPEQARPEDDNARPTSARTATPTTGNTAFDAQRADSPHHGSTSGSDYFARGPGIESEKFPTDSRGPPKSTAYTHTLRHQPARSFAEQLNPWNGRLNHDKWLKVMVRPFILFAYPSVLWSTVIYSCSVGWLIVISETMSVIYRNSDSYNFTALQTGLVYISPFVGGILGTVVAGKVSDIIVRALARRNGGLYEPEFRLIMAVPILLSTVIGLMGFGWSAEERDHWMVPTFFFGVVSFGCTMGSTTSITYCVDSYRQYAGEALVTLNFSKNILHGLVFSLFVTHWMASDGPKTMFIWLGVIQLIFCLFSIPMYIFGKRARMWTVRKNFMEKF
ncbi:putative MFS-type transporter like protein [Verticillium longisporum]|nr:putative MFS-type transporter like protein [Verticillium longisporum]